MKHRTTSSYPHPRRLARGPRLLGERLVEAGRWAARLGVARLGRVGGEARQDRTLESGPGQTSAIKLLLKPLRARIGQLACLSGFINLLSLAVPVFVLQVYDRVVFSGGMETLKGLIVIVLLAVGFDMVLRQARCRLVQMIAVRVDVATTRELFSKLTGMPLKRLEGQSDSYWRRLLRDADTLRDGVAGPTTVLLVDLPFIPLFVIVIWTVAAPVAWALLALIPVYLLLAVASSHLIGRSSTVERDAANRRDSLTGELVNGRADIKALNLGPHLRDRFERGQADLILSSIARGAKVDGFGTLTTGVGFLTTVILTTVGALAIIAQEMTIGGLIAANMLAGRIVQPLTQLVSAWRGLARLRQSLSEIEEIAQAGTDRQHTDVNRRPPEGVLTLDEVTFRHDADRPPVLNDLSLILRPGGVHGIVGPNGCGKTTLLKILQGLYTPDRGRVLLDGADLTQFGRSDLARWIGYVPQDPFLFAGSLRDNIAKGREDLDDEAILAAAKRAGVDGFVDALPDGYGTQIGEAGRLLSSGQRQRLALARALVDNPPILLLDEPSASLDFEAEDSLRDQLRLLGKTRNVIVVSHSRRLLGATDNLLVMKDGEIAMAGRSREVLRLLLSSREGASRKPTVPPRKESLSAA